MFRLKPLEFCYAQEGSILTTRYWLVPGQFYLKLQLMGCLVYSHLLVLTCIEVHEVKSFLLVSPGYRTPKSRLVARVGGGTIPQPQTCFSTRWRPNLISLSFFFPLLRSSLFPSRWLFHVPWPPTNCTHYIPPPKQFDYFRTCPTQLIN